MCTSLFPYSALLGSLVAMQSFAAGFPFSFNEGIFDPAGPGSTVVYETYGQIDLQPASDLNTLLLEFVEHRGHTGFHLSGPIYDNRPASLGYSSGFIGLRLDNDQIYELDSRGASVSYTGFNIAQRNYSSPDGSVEVPLRKIRQEHPDATTGQLFIQLRTTTEQSHVPGRAFGSFETLGFADLVFRKEPQIVWLNFDATPIRVASPKALGGNEGIFLKPEFFNPLEGFAIPGSRQISRESVLNNVALAYADYNIEFVSERPTDGDYSTVHIGGSQEAYEAAGGYVFHKDIAGFATLDTIDNADKNDYAFVFSESHASKTLFESKVSKTIVHEVGHLLGLYHVTDHDDIMHHTTENASLTEPFVPGRRQLYAEEHNRRSPHIDSSRYYQDADACLSRSLGRKDGTEASGPCSNFSHEASRTGKIEFEFADYSGLSFGGLKNAELGLLQPGGESIIIPLGDLTEGDVVTVDLDGLDYFEELFVRGELEVWRDDAWQTLKLSTVFDQRKTLLKDDWLSDESASFYMPHFESEFTTLQEMYEIGPNGLVLTNEISPYELYLKPIASIPEPSTILAGGMGLIVLSSSRRIESLSEIL
ncbi:MAG: matrixin family metalloprotease [Planctomycetota bacterium]